MKVAKSGHAVLCLAILASALTGCGDGKPTITAASPPVRNAFPQGSNGTAGPTGTDEKPTPPNGPEVSAILTWEVCQAGKGMKGTQCSTGGSACPGTVVIPMPAPDKKDGTATGNATVSQPLASGLTLNGTVQLTTNPDGSILVAAAVGDSGHSASLGEQQVAITGSLDQLPPVVVSSGQQTHGDLTYTFELNLAANGQNPLCQKEPVPGTKPSGEPTQVPTQAPTQAPAPKPTEVPPAQKPTPAPAPLQQTPTGQPAPTAPVAS